MASAKRKLFTYKLLFKLELKLIAHVLRSHLFNIKPTKPFVVGEDLILLATVKMSQILHVKYMEIRQIISVNGTICRNVCCYR